MITIKTKDGNVEIDEKDVYLITSGIPAAFCSVVFCKQGEAILAESSVYSIKAALENEKGVYVNKIHDPNGITFLVQTIQFSSSEFENVPCGTMDSESRVEHPNYYNLSNGIEVLDIVRDLPFNIGNVVKYVIRAGKKKEAGLSDKQKQIEDLEKAKFYIEDAIKQLNKED